MDDTPIFERLAHEYTTERNTPYESLVRPIEIEPTPQHPHTFRPEPNTIWVNTTKPFGHTVAIKTVKVEGLEPKERETQCQR